MIRPDPQALWERARPELWERAQLTYARQGREGEWKVRQRVPEEWELSWQSMKFWLRPTSFKHTGLFPEQASNWEWLQRTVGPEDRVLNLFGYTGGATVAAASTGATVTHVDASKPVVTWTRENLELSGLGEAKVRLIVDDAVKFVAREARRGNKYSAVFMDPPAFGRGPTGEVWKFEEGLPLLLRDVAQILTPERGTLLVNAYSLGYSALVIENTVRSYLPWPIEVETVQLCLQESTDRGFLLPAGIAVRATWGR
jgi:23S rRNA (cytosine1962-C5)-methyltransferase